MKRRNKKSATGSAIDDTAIPKIGDDDTALFRNAVRDVAPLPASGKIAISLKHPRPIPRQIPREEQTAPEDSLSDHIPDRKSVV